MQGADGITSTAATRLADIPRWVKGQTHGRRRAKGFFPYQKAVRQRSVEREKKKRMRKHVSPRLPTARVFPTRAEEDLRLLRLPD